ncbi:hypothetical protein SUGI_0602580 [Cryptomeria japonica]|uniref:receptor-like protein kinase 7 n=1 Tax=Cryptomeria japonica TaxID=3369 RepID=UPI0024147572|nr:receptor-like protein kinase 7 [Cryptomeria japonica]GLJ30440.1 hypothetical protein SUGI_0602580 [Cryptomeria japonica]
MEMRKSKKGLFVVILLAIWLNCLLNAEEEELRLLLRIKESVQDTGNYLRNWDASSSAGSPCAWGGIVCNREGSVVRIDLQGSHLRGQIPSGFCGLKSLQSLRLDRNAFHGSFPVELLNCSKLEILTLSNNQLTGALPDLSPLKSLKKLDLSSNDFSGDFPVSVCHLTSLVYLAAGSNPFNPRRLPEELMMLKNLNWLYLSTCNFIGEIPPWVGNLTELGNLELSDNHLKGTIPKELSRLKKLYQLELYRNSLSGHIPPELGNLTSLRDFDASRNFLSGSIPAEFGNLKNLVFIQLYQNNLSGPIPEGFGEMKHLFAISMYQNSLTGSLPAKLGSLSNFNMMDVSQNRLSGPLPPDLCKGGNLQYILVLDNEFSGEIPESYQYCKSVLRFRVNKNKLSGRIPQGIWGLPHVSIIDLSLNDFEGPIGADIGNARNLSELYLQRNRFQGPLPPEIGRAINLNKIDASRNQLTGFIPPEIGKLSMLSNLLLQENQLSGHIPAELGRCKFMSSINLAKNRLTGSIPGSLGSIEVLNYLNLSDNMLSGQIPSSLASLKLSSVDFSVNSLEGPVPLELINEAENRSFTSNPGLCGQGLKYLQPCDIRRKSLYDARLIAGWIFGILFTIFVIACFMVRRRKLHKRDNKVDSRAFWDIKSFHKLTFDEHEVLEAMDEEHVIGQGGSGTVYRIELSNGESVAVKKLRSCKNSSIPDNYDPRVRERLKAEVETLGTIRHKNIVKLYCCFTNGDSNMLVYEYMPNGNLWDALHGSLTLGGGTIDWPTRYKIALGVANGLSYLHHDCRPPIIHRDVKSTNILLDSDYQARVADFGFAKVFQACARGDSVTSAIPGTLGYFAPEYAYSTKVTVKSDIYSFGVVLLELITGKNPVEEEFGENRDIVYWISRKVLSREGASEVLDSRIWHSYKNEMIQALKIAVMCVNKLPNERPSMRDVVQMLLDANPCLFKTSKDEDPKKLVKQAPLMADNIPSSPICKDVCDCKPQYKV